METVGQVHERMMNNLDDKYSKIKGDFPYDVTKTTAIELIKLDNNLEIIESKLNIENLAGAELEQRITERSGLIRKLATYSQGLVTLTGQEGATVEVGDLVASEVINYIIQENKTIDTTGNIKVYVICELSGSVGNVPVGAIRFFPVTIQGITSVTNETAFTNGYESEIDKDLLERYYDKIRTPATSSNISHYRDWSMEVIGVGDVKIIPLWNGDNTVKILIIDSNKHVADTLLIDTVQNYIDPKGIWNGINWTTWGSGYGQAPIGAFCTVTTPAGLAINVSVTIIADGTQTDEVILQGISEGISDYLKEIAFKTNENGDSFSVFYNKIGNIIFDTKGVLDFSNLILNGITENIAITHDELAVLGSVVIV